MRLTQQQQETDRKVREVGKNDRIAAWVEPAIIGIVGIVAGWLTELTWVPILIVVLWGLHVVMRELAHLRALLYWYHTAQEEQHIRSRVVLGWLLSDGEDPSRGADSACKMGRGRMGHTNEGSRALEGLEERITQYLKEP